ncbi:MAG: histone H1 protein [Pseudomonadota bacterium]
MKKSLEEKLAASVRQAKKTQQERPAQASQAVTVTASDRPQQAPVAKPGKPCTFANHNDQAPSAKSLDDPWGNLYPKRVWPD